MVQLPPDSERFGTGVQSDGHGSNDGYVQPEVQSALEEAWDDLDATLRALGEDPPPQLFISAANLVAGGLFDIQQNWRKPHVGHRFGLDVDLVPMENMTEQQQALLADQLRARGFLFPVATEAPSADNPDHWRARFPG